MHPSNDTISAGPAVPVTLSGPAAAGQSSVPGRYDTSAYHKDGSAYGNQFSDGGRTITWFAQPRHTRDTPVLQRIIPGLAKEGGVDASGSPLGQTPVMLFFRLPGRPYVFAGRCDMAAVDMSASPIRVQWRMRHFGALCSLAARDPKLYEGWVDMHSLVLCRYGASALRI